MTHSDHLHSPHEVTVEVSGPRTTESKTFTWPLTLTVGQAAQEAAVALGFTSSTTTTLGRLHPSDTFDRAKTLQEVHVHEHEELELLDVGGGV